MSDPHKTTLSTTEARQGITHQGVRYVLIVSVTLAVIAMVIAYLVA